MGVFIQWISDDLINFFSKQYKLEIIIMIFIGAWKSPNVLFDYAQTAQGNPTHYIICIYYLLLWVEPILNGFMYIIILLLIHSQIRFKYIYFCFDPTFFNLSSIVSRFQMFYWTTFL